MRAIPRCRIVAQEWMIGAVAAVAVVLAPTTVPALAQDSIGFPKQDFGKIVLSQKQFGGKLESSIGHYNNEPISKYGRRSLFVQLGRSIGRVDIQTDTGTFPCTGFLISDTHLLTNYHCVPGILDNPRAKSKRIEAVQLVLGYVRDGIEKGVRRYTVSITPIEYDQTLDYSILKVEGNPGRRFGRLALAGVQPVDSAPYWIIGHPMGEAQRISREDCQSDTPAVAGGRLRHRCDTLPGNSGSPVIDPALRAAVALHHAGSSRASINYAIPIARIARHSPIIAGLLKENAVSSPLRKQMRPRPSTSPSGTDGKWVGEWCSLKPSSKGETCRQIMFDLREGVIRAQTGVEGQPGFAAFNGEISVSGKVVLNVRGVRARGERRGEGYEGSLSGYATNHSVDLAGSYPGGRGVTLKLRRDPAKLSLGALKQVRGKIPAASSHAVPIKDPYDGVWWVLVGSASNCPRSFWKFKINIENSNISGGRRMRSTTVDKTGKFRIIHTGRRGRHIVFQYDGVLNGHRGAAIFRVLDRRCRGTATLQKLSGNYSGWTNKASVVAREASNPPDLKGVWRIVRTGSGCRVNRIEFSINVDSGLVTGSLRGDTPISGSVADRGFITFAHPNVRQGGPRLRYDGVLVGRTGSGRFVAERGNCRGSFSATGR